MPNRLLLDCQGRPYGPLKTIGVIAGAAILIALGFGGSATLMGLAYHFGVFVVWIEPIETWDQVRQHYSMLIGVVLFGGTLSYGWWAYRVVTNGQTYCRMSLCRVHTRRLV